MSENVNKRYIILRLLIFVAIVVSIITAALSSQHLYEEYQVHISFLKFLRDTGSALILLIIPITLINLILRYLRWALLLRTFNILSPSRELFFSYMTGFTGNSFPLYLPYLIRLVPLKNKVFGGFLILILDLGLDFISIVLLFNFGSVSFLSGTAFILLVSVLVATLQPSKGEGKIIGFSNQFTGVVLSLSITVLIWSFTSLSLYLTLMSLGYGINFIESQKIFCESLYTGSLSYIPAGIATTGVAMINSLKSINIPTETAVYTTMIVRALTFWLTLFLAVVAFIIYGRMFGRNKNSYHFDEIADSYQDTIPEHLRKQFLDKKIDINLEFLPQDKYVKGVDAGCGQGWYLKEMIDKGYEMYGFDYSDNQVKKAAEYLGEKGKGILQTSSITEMPYPDNNFDFLYTINMIHHLQSSGQQLEAYREVHRVLKQGGRFIIHEMNIKNPLFRFYLSYIFPLIKNIDEGTEIWVKNLDHISDMFEIKQIVYKTFTPDFLPAFLLKAFAPVEKKLEKSRIFSRFSAHITFVLEKK